MEMHFEELLSKITDFMKSEAKTQTVIGEVFELGAFKCVPVIKVGMGFGSGGGEGVEPKKGTGQGGGAAGGVGIEPIGFLVSREDQISFIKAGNTQGLAAAFEKIPEIISSFAEKKAAAPDPA